VPAAPGRLLAVTVLLGPAVFGAARRLGRGGVRSRVGADPSP